MGQILHGCATTTEAVRRLSINLELKMIPGYRSVGRHCCQTGLRMDSRQLIVRC